MSNKLASLRRDLEHIRKHRTEILQQKSRLATRLSDLNKDLRSKKIPYEHYESKFKYLLGGKSTEEKKKYFKKRLVAIKHREKDLLSRIKHETNAIKNRTKLIAVTVAMFVIFAPIIGLNLVELTGLATSVEVDTDSRVEVQSWLAASFSVTTIQYGGSLIAGTVDNNASLNYAGAASSTGYYLTLDEDSNVNAKTCIKGTAISGPTTLALGNATWNSSTSSGATIPATPGDEMTTSYATSQTSISPGDKDYYRFWMDVPSGQTPGDYETNITVNAVVAGSSC